MQDEGNFLLLARVIW